MVTDTFASVRRAVIVVAAASALACSSWRQDLKPVAYQEFDCGTGESPSVELRYLGSGGWFIRGPDDAILTAPFFSNPSALAVALSFAIPLQEDLDLIATGMRGVPKTASAILVGHSHYDHLMEVPIIARHYARGDAKIYLNATGRNLLLDEEFGGRSVVVDGFAGSDSAAGAWLSPSPKASIRFMALRSEHAPHLGPIKLFQGHVTKPNPNSRNAWDWREGQTHAFIIDIMRDDKPVFRIHYQDSASNPKLGFPPDLGDDKRVDVAIVCMASFGNVDGYPNELLTALKPRHVLVGHWESFFTKGELTSVPFTSTRDFAEALTKALADPSLRGTTATTPYPGATLRYCVQ